MSGEVPGGWERRSLMELCSPVREAVDVKPDSAYQEIGIRSHGKGVFIKPPTTGAKLGDKRVFRVVPDVFVANIVFAWEGALARTTKEHEGMVASHRFPMWKPTPERLDLDYLVQFFRTDFGVDLAAQASPGGAGRNRTLNQTAFLRSLLLLPPLPEQKKIAAILSSLDEAIQATQAVLDQTRRVKEGLLQDLLTRGLGHTRFKQTEIGEIPESWEAVALGDVLDDMVPGKSLLTGDEPASESEWGVLKVSAIGQGEFREHENKRLPDGFEVRFEHRVRGGDVLISRANTANLVGACCRVPLREYRLMLSDKTLRLVPNAARITPDFLAESISQPKARSFFSQAATGSSASMKNLSQSTIAALPLFLPPISEQTEIAERLDAVAKAADGDSEALARLVRLKSALLTALLTGRVRVTL